ncbi:MAG: hypothetical protein P8Z77_10975, partial [Candidatus Thiodiazotropha sp.]
MSTSDHDLEAWITLDHKIHNGKGTLTCLLSTDSTQEGSTIQVQARNGSAIQVRVPAYGFMVFA